MSDSVQGVGVESNVLGKLDDYFNESVLGKDLYEKLLKTNLLDFENRRIGKLDSVSHLMDDISISMTDRDQSYADFHSISKDAFEIIVDMYRKDTGNQIEACDIMDEYMTKSYGRHVQNLSSQFSTLQSDDGQRGLGE